VLRLTLVRHGQTEANAARRFAGREDTPLTATGEQMAEALAAALSGEAFDAIYTSPLQRARNTAKPLATALGLTPTVLDGLQEYDCGTWVGRTRAQVWEDEPGAMQQFAADPTLHAPPGGETAIQVRDRARESIAQIRAAHTDGHVLVASHKGTLRVILCDWLGIDLREYRRRVDWPLCAVTRVDWHPEDGPLLRSLNALSHLPGDLRSLAVAG